VSFRGCSRSAPARTTAYPLGEGVTAQPLSGLRSWISA